MSAYALFDLLEQALHVVASTFGVGVVVLLLGYGFSRRWLRVFGWSLCGLSLAGLLLFELVIS